MQRPHLETGASFWLPALRSSRLQTTQERFFFGNQWMQNQLDEQSSDQTSDFNAAKIWLDSYDETRSSIEWNDNSRREIETLLRALLWIFECQPNPSLPPFLWCDVSHKTSFFERDQENSVCFRAPSWMPRRLAEVLNAHFQLKFNTRRRIRGYSHWVKGFDNVLPTLSAAPPTAHEKLEAHLLWRQWLRGKICEAEIDALLPPI